MGAERLVLVAKGAQIILVPSAFTLATGKDHWEVLLRARAIETQCYIVSGVVFLRSLCKAAAAQFGKHNERRTSYGHACIVDCWGAVVAEVSDGTGIAMAKIDLDYQAQIRASMPVQSHRRGDIYTESK